MSTLTPDLPGTFAGALTIAVMIVVARNARVEHWMWSASLVALPLFYAGFGVLAKDASAIELEMLYGIPFFFVGA